MEFEDIPEKPREQIAEWADKYAPVHAVSHWDDAKQKRVSSYQEKLEDAAEEAEGLLATAGRTLAPALLESYPALIWEDQDECLEVRPEDIPL